MKSSLTNLLNILKYLDSEFYRSQAYEFEIETVHLFRAASKIGTESHKEQQWINGAYVVQTSPKQLEITPLPTRTIVYVADAKNKQHAREIHKGIWNLGKVPFLLINLPDEVRIYTGFDYDNKEDQGLLDVFSWDDPYLVEKLEIFSSESIDSGRLWDSNYAAQLTDAGQVDKRLLSNLRKLNSRLQKNLHYSISSSLIGKYIYLRYLWDRKIITPEWLEFYGINKEDIFTRKATKSSLRKLSDYLEQRFNGQIFPLDFDKIEDEHVRYTASVFLGDQPIGSDSIQMALDFQIYNFEYIPIETLSSVYEQFIDLSPQHGAVYTSEVLSDFVLSEINSIVEISNKTRIFDPACGSGIFLVLAYRRLIEIFRRKKESRLDRDELKTILENHIFGIERDANACRVTELSLILTLLHEVEPRELHYSPPDFKLPNLRNKNIFEADFFDDSSKFWQIHKEKAWNFSWIVGNPPWVKIDRKQAEDEAILEEYDKPIAQQLNLFGEMPEARYSRNKSRKPPLQKHALSWIKENSLKYPVSDYSLEQAFSWHTSDLLEPDGVIGLILPATILFNDSGVSHTSEVYRKKFFSHFSVKKVSNFSRLNLFQAASMPGAVFIYKKRNDDDQEEIIHYGPLTRTVVWQNNSANWALTINANEITYIPYEDAESGKSLIWKVALWGTQKDLRTISQIRNLFPNTLESFCEKQNWGKKLPEEGPQFRTLRGEGKEIIVDTKKFDVVKFNEVRDRYQFSFPEGILVEHKGGFRLRRGNNAFSRLTKSPHIIISSAWNFILYSDQDFVIPNRTSMGISAPVNDATLLSALSIYLNSSMVYYYLFFVSPQLGVWNNRTTVSSVRTIPVPDFTAESVRKLDELRRKIVNNEQNNINMSYKEKRKIIDDLIFELFPIPINMRHRILDFVNLKIGIMGNQEEYEYLESVPSESLLYAYAEQLRDELDSFMMQNYYSKVTVNIHSHLIECVVDMSKQYKDKLPVEVSISNSKESNKIKKNLRQQKSQWIYIQKKLWSFVGERIHLFKPCRLIEWTRSQAMDDATEIISQILS